MSDRIHSSCQTCQKNCILSLPGRSLHGRGREDNSLRNSYAELRLARANTLFGCANASESKFRNALLKLGYSLPN